MPHFRRRLHIFLSHRTFSQLDRNGDERAGVQLPQLGKAAADGQRERLGEASAEAPDAVRVAAHGNFPAQLVQSPQHRLGGIGRAAVAARDRTGVDFENFTRPHERFHRARSAVGKLAENRPRLVELRDEIEMAHDVHTGTCRDFVILGVIGRLHRAHVAGEKGLQHQLQRFRAPVHGKLRPARGQAVH